MSHITIPYQVKEIQPVFPIEGWLYWDNVPKPDMGAEADVLCRLMRMLKEKARPMDVGAKTLGQIIFLKSLLLSVFDFTIFFFSIAIAWYTRM